MKRPSKTPHLKAEEFDLDRLLPPFRATDAASRWLFGLQRLGIRPGLERIDALLERLGHPERGMDAVVVAGTNGKGTAASYLAALSQAAGRRTGLYTSPHLLRVHERILVDGLAIDEGSFADRVNECRPHIEAADATFFEAMTAICLLHFARVGVELAVLETGLGGRLDATNAVDARGALLTSVGLDHQHILGESLEEIAAEKLGLARAGRPFYTADLDPPIRDLALRMLRAAGAEAVELSWVPSLAEDPHSGGSQNRLAAIALACYDDLAKRYGWPRPELAGVLNGLRVPARYDVVGERPELIIDTAHNAPALDRLFRQWSGEGRREERILVMGVMHDKRIDEIMEVAAASAGHIFSCAPQWNRSLPSHELALRLAEGATRARSSGALAGVGPLIVDAGRVRLALESARTAARQIEGAGGRASVLVTGSNFTVAEALDRLGIDDLHAQPSSPDWEAGRPLRTRENAEGKVAMQ